MHDPDPDSERLRLEVLRGLGPPAGSPGEGFDDLARLAASACGTPIALVTLVDADRVWFKAAHGLTIAQVPRRDSFCAQVVAERGVVVVPDARTDPRFSGNPLVAFDPHVRFYAGAPLLTAEGMALGTVCVLDDVPRILEPRQADTLRVLARHVVGQMERRVESERRATLLQVTNAIITHLELDRLLHATFEALRRVLPSDRSALTIYRKETDSLRIFAFEGPSPSPAFQVGIEVPRERSAPGWVFDHQRPLLRRDLALEHEFDVERRLLQEGVRSLCMVPLIVGGRSIGTLNVGSYTPGSFTPAHVALLQEVGNQVALAVANTQAYEEIAALRARLHSENAYLREEIRSEHDFEEIVGRSPGLLEVLRQVESVAPTDSTVLISGETGTGKELFARAIHQRSPRRDRPLVKVNCGAIPPGLVESELFGHVKGAFTGALQSRTGRFELADGGTLFLDEVSELTPEVQVKLLRALQEQEFEPVGSARTIRVDVRLIAATNRDLEEAVASGRFRADLLYRLNVFPLLVPPLRERVADIPLLASFFLGRHSRRLGRSIERISPRTMALLTGYEWPGNVRELQNVIERASILAQGSVLDFERELLAGRPSPKVDSEAGTLEGVERAHIARTLRRTGWVVDGTRGAAAILGLHPNTLRSRMKRLGILRPAGDGAHEIS